MAKKMIIAKAENKRYIENLIRHDLKEYIKSINEIINSDPESKKIQTESEKYSKKLRQLDLEELAKLIDRVEMYSISGSKDNMMTELINFENAVSVLEIVYM